MSDKNKQAKMDALKKLIQDEVDAKVSMSRLASKDMKIDADEPSVKELYSPDVVRQYENEKDNRSEEIPNSREVDYDDLEEDHKVMGKAQKKRFKKIRKSMGYEDE